MNIKFLLNSYFLAWLPVIFFLIIILLAGFFYFKKKEEGRGAAVFFILIFASIYFRFFYAFLLSLLQYYAWTQDAIGKLFLPPYQTIDYFLFYVW